MNRFLRLFRGLFFRRDLVCGHGNFRRLFFGLFFRTLFFGKYCRFRRFLRRNFREFTVDYRDKLFYLLFGVDKPVFKRGKSAVF